MGKLYVDKTKLKQSRGWLKKSGAKNKVEALLSVDPTLKDFVDQSLASGKSPMIIANELSIKMKGMGTEEWQIPSFLSIQNYRDKVFSQSNYNAGTIMNKSPQIRHLYKVVSENVDTVAMLGKLILDSFEVLQELNKKELKIGYPMKAGTERLKVFCDLATTYEAIKKEMPVINQTNNIVGNINIQNNIQAPRTTEETIKEARKIISKIEQLHEEAKKRPTK